MILIAGFGMLMVFGMPYLLENSKSSIPFPFPSFKEIFCG